MESGQGDVNRGRMAPNFQDLVNNCLDSRESDPAIADPEAINVYIYDATSYDFEELYDRRAIDSGVKSISVETIHDACVLISKDDTDWTSGGNDNEGRPYVRIDYARIYDDGDWNLYAVFEHEMGHAFTLLHVCNDEDADQPVQRGLTVQPRGSAAARPPTRPPSARPARAPPDRRRDAAARRPPGVLRRLLRIHSAASS